MDLLERTGFLRALAEYAAEAQQGDGRLVLLSGESGIGKTALIEAFQRSVKSARWLWGACDGLSTPRPLAPVFDVGAQAGGELAGLCRQGAPRDRLFTAFLAEMDAPGTLTVVVMEDLHWADDATVDLVSFLGRRLGRLPALVLASYRDDELGADHPLRVVLGDLATQRATRRMKLPPLSEGAVRSLAAGRDVDTAELYRLTGGNPFYVCEILEAGWPSVPPTVRDAVGARLARCSAGTRRAVESAAVIGARVPWPLLAPVLDDCGSSAEDCLATGILVVDGADLRFRHELVRIAVANRVAPYRQAELHARVLAALEKRGDADPALLAHHAEGAGDGAAVSRHAPEAGRRSSRLGAHRAAAAQFERVLRFADDGAPAVLAALHEAVADEYALLDRWEEAEESLRTALRLRRELDDDLQAGEDLRQLSTALWRLCRGEESGQAAEEAVRVLEARTAGPELAWAYANLSVFYSACGRVGDAVSVGEQAVSLGERLHRPDVMSDALNTIGCALADDGRDGIGSIERALQIALDAGLQEAVGRAYCNLQSLTAVLNRFADAEHYFDEGISYCEGRELGVYSTCLNGGRAYTLLLTGRWDEAEVLCGELLARQRISPINRLNPLLALGSICTRRGSAGAQDLLDEALVLAEGAAQPQWIVPVRAARAELSWVRGEPERAVQEVQAGYDCGLGRCDPWEFGSLAIWLSRLGVEAGPLPGLCLPEPFELELAGDWPGAVAVWQRLCRPV